MNTPSLHDLAARAAAVNGLTAWQRKVPFDRELQLAIVAQYHELGRHDECLARCETLLERGHDDELVLFLRARALVGLGRWRAASESLDRVEASVPGHPTVRVLRPFVDRMLSMTAPQAGHGCSS